ncbi:hypothetical protein MC885_000329, partial [Smutsia gigantea]
NLPESFTHQRIQASWQRSPVQEPVGVEAGLAFQSDSRMRRLAIQCYPGGLRWSDRHFTLGGMQGKLNKFGNLVAAETADLAPGGRGLDLAVSFPDVRMKCPLAGTNKRFLLNTIKNTLPSHKEQDQEQKEGSEEPAQSQKPPEEGRKPRRAPAAQRGSQARARRAASPSPPGKRARPGHGSRGADRRGDRRTQTLEGESSPEALQRALGRLNSSTILLFLGNAPFGR